MAKNDQKMRKVNLNEIKEDPWQSPGGKYAASFKGISEALGRELNNIFQGAVLVSQVRRSTQAFDAARATVAARLASDR